MFGPQGHTRLLLALDTVASRTVIAPLVLESVGCVVSDSAAGLMVATGSRREFMPLVGVSKLSALGHLVENLSVLAHQLPAGMAVHGLLGLDFFTGCRLELNFRAGTILLEPPHD